MGRGELIEADAGLRGERDLRSGAIGAAQCHDFFGDLLAERGAVGLALPVGDLGQADIQCGVQHGPLRWCEPHQAPVSGCDNRGLHRGSGRRLDIDRVGAALPVDGADRVVNRAVDNRQRARLQDRIRGDCRRVQRDHIPVGHLIRVGTRNGKQADRR